jgi:hypothetical protein
VYIQKEDRNLTTKPDGKAPLGRVFMCARTVS